MMNTSYLFLILATQKSDIFLNIQLQYVDEIKCCNIFTLAITTYQVRTVTITTNYLFFIDYIITKYLFF